MCLRLSIGLACPLVSLSVLSAQSLRLAPAAASPGDSVAVELSFQSPSGRESSALQWEASVPRSRLDFETPGVTAGPAARAAGKSVSCAPKGQESATSRTVACILYGGQERIPDGVVAVLRLKALPQAAPGDTPILVDHAITVSKDLRSSPLKPAAGSVTIRPTK